MKMGRQPQQQQQQYYKTKNGIKKITKKKLGTAAVQLSAGRRASEINMLARLTMT